MKKVKYGVLIVVAITVIVLGFSSVISTIIIKYTGKKVVAAVTEIPSTCDRYNHIKVLLDNTEYEVNISRPDCREGVYKVGQKVELLKNERYEELVWPESQPELVPLLIIAVFILAYISMKGRYKK
jgi:hypothetical protein